MTSFLHRYVFGVCLYFSSQNTLPIILPSRDVTVQGLCYSLMSCILGFILGLTNRIIADLLCVYTGDNDNLRDVLQMCLSFDASKRPHAATVCLRACCVECINSIVFVLSFIRLFVH